MSDRLVFHPSISLRASVQNLIRGVAKMSAVSLLHLVVTALAMTTIVVAPQMNDVDVRFVNAIMTTWLVCHIDLLVRTYEDEQVAPRFARLHPAFKHPTRIALFMLIAVPTGLFALLALGLAHENILWQAVTFILTFILAFDAIHVVVLYRTKTKGQKGRAIWRGLGALLVGLLAATGTVAWRLRTGDSIEMALGFGAVACVLGSAMAGVVARMLARARSRT